ncbi:hypothetical protein SAMN02745857_03793 [Andreprevotia lacus DSM 23236]|jgi:hypothetical protein|uniref:Uncharacterized protein n=1 Tax=Andreprevotia lacus DSM 23236 TaxID=1121001 RepID=A0A1W1XZS3_9NEIS|nr:hypothetical protein [Andreprevotia lacus]SMC29375.1 hypothetical protein SAMN02745857_03793 [Andreprevotia lacus DSM 23236]
MIRRIAALSFFVLAPAFAADAEGLDLLKLAKDKLSNCSSASCATVIAKLEVEPLAKRAGMTEKDLTKLAATTRRQNPDNKCGMRGCWEYVYAARLVDQTESALTRTNPEDK